MKIITVLIYFSLIMFSSKLLALEINRPLKDETAMTIIPDIVYVRVPRTTEKTQISLLDNRNFSITSPDIWDRLPDTKLIQKGFNAPGQLVFRSSNKQERILFDCTLQKTPCVPLDPSISDDGKRIIFSVYRGSELSNTTIMKSKLPNRILSGLTEAQLHIANLDTGVVSPLFHTPGNSDISPAWLTNGKILFASDRSNFTKPDLHTINLISEPVFQLYIADHDGKNARNITPHELSGAIHPYILRNGRIAYSSQWLNHNLAYFKNNGGINWPSTLANSWVLTSMNSQGGDMTILLGGHRNMFKKSDKKFESLKALHFIGQRENEDICVDNYYRGNNLGLGDILCWPPEPHGVEGALTNFLPRGLYSAAIWSVSNDEAAAKKNGIFQGKIGYPEGIQNNQLMLTFGKGYCTQVISNILKAQENVSNQPNQLGCDTGIYATSQIPSTTPEDLIKIVDEPNWHEFSARAIIPKNISLTESKETPKTNKCILISSDAGSSETSSNRPYKFNKNFFTAANNGGEIDGIPHAEMTSIRFWEVLPNRKNRHIPKNSIGNEIRLLGDVRLLADQSFSVELPCDTPYIMAGLDNDGRVIKRDQLPQSLRVGETRICNGCHLHSRPGKPFVESLAYSSEPFQLTQSKPVPHFETDIKPIFQEHCMTCHTKDVPLLDYNKLVWDYFQQYVAEERKVLLEASKKPKNAYGLQRPYTSKYVNNMFARESLLYWKAANKRTDGRSDSTYPDDIDFNSPHPTEISDEELSKIGEWLDSGAAQ